MKPAAKKVTGSCVAVLTFLAAGCSAGHESGSGHDNTLIMGDSFSLTHPIGRSGTQEFLDDVEEAGADHGLSVDYFASGQMGKQWDMTTILRTGVADIGPISPSYTASEMPLSSVGDLPGLVEDSCVGAYALRDLMSEGGILYEEEFAPLNLRPLWVGVIPAYEAMMAELEVVNPGDLEGSVLRSTGGAQDRIVDAVGAAGVGMPIGDFYESLTRGTVEGTVISPISITPYGLEEVLGYSTRGANLGSFTTVYSINEDTWQSLTEDQKEYISELADNSQQSVCDELNAEAETAFGVMEDAGVKFIDASDNTQWQELLEPVREGWVRDLEAMDRPAGMVLDEFEKALDSHAHRAEGDAK